MIKRCIVCLFLLLSMLLLPSCDRGGPSREYMSMKEQGFYPDNKDFPNTKWVCQEMDMYFCMLEHTRIWIGEYTIDDVTYPFTCGQRPNSNFLYIYTTSTVSLPTNEGFLDDWNTKQTWFSAFYIYRNGVIEFNNIEEEGFSETLTFAPAGNIAQIPHERWYAKEIDMYMDSFQDIDNFYKGILVYNGETYSFEAFQCTIEGTYLFKFYSETTYFARSATMRLVYDKKSNTMIGTLYSDSQDIGQTGPKITFTKEKPQ